MIVRILRVRCHIGEARVNNAYRRLLLVYACSWSGVFVFPDSTLSQDSSRDWKNRYEPCLFRGSEAASDAPSGDAPSHDTIDLPYLLLRPETYDPKRKYPLVIFLHGAGERGTDNQKQLIHGLIDFAQPQAMRSWPCFVVAPQCPEQMQWVDTPWTAEKHSMPAQPTAALRQSIRLAEKMQVDFSVDPQRIYITGLSMGGFGVWDAIQRYPSMFAAALPVCGGGDETLAKSIAEIPLWAFHGDKDDVVLPIRTRNMIAALKQAGGSPKYTDYAGVTHNSWTQTYANKEVLGWLFQQRKVAP